ncbi:MAG: hypothetical protein UT11_C0027G0011 [Berkelbacteria bacterium GW2011_GWA2_38_9]|uniref:Uncharacterized protein n=1 Tax=Berkelbacteria bacterium GW2011_GWA2_38_9 TaxID=1618334 RepID=A0A0G0PJ82_9BACT|nr:MAG: hypothetical protein UT11_C0027G0011 [Berkelbacteria bacterium GW2011_GWA2_38_9]
MPTIKSKSAKSEKSESKNAGKAAEKLGKNVAEYLKINKY